MVLISFRKNNLKIEYTLVVIIVLVSLNLYSIEVLDSNLTENYTNSIPNTGSIAVDSISKEVETELQTKIVSWGEIIANNSNLATIDNIISYPDDALVKVRDDNKMEFIVKRDTLDFSQDINEFLSKYNVKIHEDVPYFNASIIYTSVENLSEFMSESESTPGITYTEPNFYCELDFVPNDEYYESDQWDLSLIGMESGWDYELGSHDVVVAVVDTGIDYTHPDLSENYIPLGYDWVNDDTDPMDDHFHGTHCAGTIAGVINNTIGISGIANVSIFTEKAFNFFGMGSHVNCRLALMHAVDMDADIISCSWGGTSSSETLLEGIEYAINNNVMVIAAAGNSNSSNKSYPAAYPEVIAVSATDQNDLKANFSNYGDWVDISAPGVDILSTVPYDIKGCYYDFASGTSMATPHVSGFAALLMSAYPTINTKQIETLIYDYSMDLGVPGFDPYYGHGRIEVTNLFGPDTTPPKYSNLIESADPLLVNSTEIIKIDVFDPSGVSYVLIEFEGSNHSMINIGGNTWQYDSWTPPNIGTYPYIIFMEDNYNNWNSVSDSIQVKEDTDPPTYLDLIESADPLEWSNTEVISIKVTDFSGVYQVLIEFEGSNHSMINIGGNIWQYDSWTPPNLGTYPYTIYMEDYYNHWSFVSDSIQVVDTTPPKYSELIESADPLELGNTEIISIKVTDLSGVYQVDIKFENTYHSMKNLGENIWQYDSWTPSNVGTYPYIIYMADNNNNYGSISDSIQVIENNSDISPPTYSNLIESADPLELGNTEVISIDVSDPSGINQVLIEFEGVNHSMINIGGNTWQLDSWIPPNIGIYPYIIYMEDNCYNWRSVSGSIQVKEDITPPIYSNLMESADPLELGNIEVISIDVTDPSGINQVLIHFEGSNHSMTNIGNNTWQYNNWVPLNTGNYPYEIYMVDNYDNWEIIINTIQIVDTTQPTCRLLTNHTEPIELGNSTAILVKATDLSGIKEVIFQYEGINYIMRDIGGDVWQFKNFTPLRTGICNYTIYIEDNNNNWRLISSSVEVRDTQAPDPPKLINFPSGNVSNQIIFDWEDGYDPSGIKFYRLIIDIELNPFLTPGFIFEANISNIDSESSYFELKESLSPGIYFFFIYQIDGTDHQSSPAKGKFTVISSNIKSPSPDSMEIIISFLGIITVTSVVGTSGYAVVKKFKSEKKIQPLNKQFEMKNYKIHIKKLRDKRLDLEREARKLVKIDNYARASVLYEQCKDISNELFKFGLINEAEKAKYYANKGSKIFQIQEQEISFIKTNINAFLTEYYNKAGIKYYTNPEIYPKNQNAVNGLILNDARFLHQILLNSKKGFILIEELNINPQTLTNYKAFQFIYTNDFSQQTISEYCVKYYNPEILLLIVNIKNVSKRELELLNSLIQEKDIKYGEGVKCISYESFGGILGLKGKNRNDFLKIFDLSKNFNSDTIIYHHTKELIETLKQKKWYLFS